MAEDPFVGTALEVARRLLKRPLVVRRGAAIFYELTLNNDLELTVDPRVPVRGRAAFQTDLCVLEQRDLGTELPRVVLEFKTRLTTHDVLTYSTKARRHKHVYPYLRYGLILSGSSLVPRRFYRHNEALDFALAVAGLSSAEVNEALALLLRREVRASRTIERLSFSAADARLYRSEPISR